MSALFASYLFVGGLCGAIFILAIVSVIIDHIRIPQYSYEKVFRAYERLKEKGGGPEWRTTLIALIGGNIILWIFFSKSVHFNVFVFVLVCMNAFLVGRAIAEYEELRLVVKRLKEFEARENAQEKF